MKRHKALLTFFVLALSCTVEANQFRVLIGPKSETASSALSSISNVNPFNLILEYDKKIFSKYFISMGASGEFDFANTSSTGFGLFGSLRYYIKGDPSLISSTGNDIKLSFVEPWSYFLGVGFFHKNITFESDDRFVRRIEGDIGGLILSAGANFSISKKYYLAAYIQYLIGGAGSVIDYTSVESYFGLGLRF